MVWWHVVGHHQRWNDSLAQLHLSDIYRLQRLSIRRPKTLEADGRAVPLGWLLELHQLHSQPYQARDEDDHRRHAANVDDARGRSHSNQGRAEGRRTSAARCFARTEDRAGSPGSKGESMKLFIAVL